MAVERPPAGQRPLAVVQAEAALQRQSTLLAASGGGGPVAAGVAAALPLAKPGPQAGATDAPPTPSSRVHWSAALAQLGAPGAPAVDAAPLAPPMAENAPPTPGPPGGVVARWAERLGQQLSVAMGRVPAPSPAASGAARVELAPAVAWPTQGVPPQVQAWVEAVVQRMLGPGWQVRQVQSWPPSMLAALWPDTPGAEEAAEGPAPALAWWRGQPGVLRGSDGQQRPFMATLRVPRPGPDAMSPPPTGGMRPPDGAPASGGALPWPQPTAQAPSGVFALVLQDEAGAWTSAVLQLELAAATAVAVYGRETPTNRATDPWVQQAAYLASGSPPGATRREQQGPAPVLCEHPDCPYAHQAPCPQPFCPAALRVPPV